MKENSKTVVCKNCSAEISAKAKVCPSCGVKNKKPIYKRWWFILAIVIVAVMIIGSLGGGNSNRVDKNAEYVWSDSELIDTVPQPNSKNGKVNYDSEDSFGIEIYKVSKEDFEEYISNCKANGFTVDYSKTDLYYSALNEHGVSLYISYDEKEKIMRVSVDAPKQVQADETANNTTDENNEEKSTEKQTENQNEKLVDGMRPEFKESMDSYEAFFDEYCAFMKKYSESDNTVELLSDYSKFMAKYSDMMSKMEKLGEEDLNDAELKYYVKVTNRINEKLLDAAL